MKELKKLLSEINEEARKYKKNIVTIYAISILLSVITIYNSLLNKLVIDEVFNITIRINEKEIELKISEDRQKEVRRQLCTMAAGKVVIE